MRPTRALMALFLVVLSYRSGFKAGHAHGTFRTTAAFLRGMTR